jgi:hypothetical protein
MATTTPNFGWPVPTSTDLVKDGATAIEALGDGIDTSLVDLKGGTTGQVLSKATSADMDFTWVTSDDANAIQNTIVDAKGDLIAASAADTPARLAVGNNGETLVADSSTSTGLRYQANFAAGKNKIINGDFGIWQRGTSFTNPGINAYTADRWYVAKDGSGSTVTVSQQTFTPGTAPVAGYEGQFFYRYAQSVAGTGANYNIIAQKIEDVRQFAGQTTTVSFWAKAASSLTLSEVQLSQSFGSGGSSDVNTTAVSSLAITTSWVRYSYTVSIPSISGKTIGTGSALALKFFLPNNAVQTLDIWGVQVEAGSVATAFQTATGTIQGELAAAQRYYCRFTAGAAPVAVYGTATNPTTTQGNAWLKYPVTMRTTPTSIDSASLCIREASGVRRSLSSIVLDSAVTNADLAFIYGTISSGTVNITGQLTADNTTSGYIGFSAEL